MPKLKLRRFAVAATLAVMSVFVSGAVEADVHEESIQNGENRHNNHRR